MLKIVENLIRLLEEKRVVYVHFKSNEHVDESVEGKTDFDLLVARSSARDYEGALLELDCRRFYSPAGAAYPGVDDWLGMDPDTGTLIHLHTHYQLVTGKSGFKNYVLPWTQIALDSRHRDPDTGLYFVSPEFELTELYTRIVAKISIRKDIRAMVRGYRLTGETLREAQWLWARTDPARLEEMLRRCFGQPEAGLSRETFFKERFTPGEYRQLRRFVLDALAEHRRAGTGAIHLRSNLYKLKVRLVHSAKKLRFLPGIQEKKRNHTGGLLIAFLGVDGSGKTTVSREISRWLGWKMETSRMSLGVGRFKQSPGYRLKQRIKRILGRKPSPEGAASLPSPDPVPRTLKNYLAQRKKVAFAREIRRDLRRIHSYCLNGGIMVVDRYPQLRFFGISDGPKVNRAFPALAEKELEYLSVAERIQPDLVFKLMVPVEVSMDRRPEDAEEVLRRKYEILQAVEYPGARTIEVDATQPLEQELLFIKKKIWENL